LRSHGKTAGVLLIFFAIVVIAVGFFILPSAVSAYPLWGQALAAGGAVRAPAVEVADER